MITCPHCDHPAGPHECIHRGRRFFLMGALALPVAKTLTVVPAVVHQHLLDSAAMASRKPPLAWARDLVFYGGPGLLTLAVPAEPELGSPRCLARR